MSVTTYTYLTYEQFYWQNLANCNDKTLNTVDSGKKEKG